MLGPLDALISLIAQAAGPAEAPSSFLLQLVPWIPVVLIFYFLMIRPQQREDRKRKDRISQIKKGDKVLTAAGIYGTVQSSEVGGDRVILRLDDEGKIKVAFTKASIVRILGDPAEEPAASK